MIAAALELAGDGHPVVPLHTPEAGGCSCGRTCTRTGKHPRAGLGLRHASTDPETVAGWWHEWPAANIGLRCDGLFVIDVDGDDGKRSLRALEQELGVLPAGRRHQTGEGYHLLFAAGVDGNSTRPLGSPAGIDVRGGTRGYIVAPPSWHRNGTRYARLNDLPVPPLPEAWLDRLRRAQERAPAAERTLEAKVATAYGEAALHGELEKLLRAPEGTRNETLNRSVFRLGQLVAGGQIPHDQVERDAVRFAVLIGFEPDEARNVVKRALHAGLRQPRQPRQVRPLRARACARSFLGLDTYEGLRLRG